MVHANHNPLIEKTAEKYAFSYALWLLTTQEMKHKKIQNLEAILQQNTLTTNYDQEELPEGHQGVPGE